MFRHRTPALLLLALVMALPIRVGAEGPHRAIITEIVDGDTVIIDPPFKDGNEIRLVGIQAPKLPLGRNNFPTWPLAPEARDALSAMVLGKPVELSFTGARRDRYGRWLAHLDVISGSEKIWVQGAMLRSGLARVYSFPDNRGRVAEMLAEERLARQDRLGIWSLAYYAIRNPEPAALADLLGTFQLIEGRVIDAAYVKGIVYLNFGPDWKTDFTVSLDRKAMRLFKGLPDDPREWTGRAVRVRGWLTDRNGPMIRATHPEQIELLDR
ncbi:MAG: thermonuclease family protein [Rhodospirillales bacterium]